MSYTICKVIYGLPLYDSLNEIENYGRSELLLEAIQEALEDNTNEMFHVDYNSADAAYAFGIELSEFDECAHHIDLDTIQTKPTENQKLQFEQQLNALPKSVYKEVKKFGNPRTFIFWDHS